MAELHQRTECRILQLLNKVRELVQNFEGTGRLVTERQIDLAVDQTIEPETKREVAGGTVQSVSHSHDRKSFRVHCLHLPEVLQNFCEFLFAGTDPTVHQVTEGES